MKNLYLTITLLLSVVLSSFAATVTVANIGTTFTPPNIIIKVGDIVQWNIGATHNVVEVALADYSTNTNNPLAGGFSTPFGGGAVTFNTAGTYYYICQPHIGLSMKGTVTVVLFGDDFENGTGQWTLNTATLGSGMVNNAWTVNNIYQIAAASPGLPPIIPATPATFLDPQPATIIPANQNYLHINFLGLPPFLPANVGPNYGGSGIGDSYFTEMSSDISTIGYSNVSFNFHYIDNGGTGSVYYSTDTGTTWLIVNATAYNGQSTWAIETLTNLAFDNQLTLRFAFRFVDNGTIVDPPFCIDQVIITGTPAPTATTTTWTGTTDTDWNTASNWTGGIVPTSTDNVDIPDISGASGNFPIMGAVTTVGDLTVAINANLTVAMGIVLDGDFTNNGSVILQNGAYLDDFTNTSSYTGNITIETMAANGTGDRQRLISSPVMMPMFSEIADDLNGPWGAGAQGTNGVAVIVDNCATPSLTSTSNYGNLFEYNEALVILGGCEMDGWVVRSSGILENARGYSAYLTSGTTFDFTGTPNTSLQSISVTNTNSTIATAEGWNLIGNPYPSPLSRDLLLANATNTALGVNSLTYYVASGPYAGSFTAYNPGDNIAIAQGIQVQTPGNGLVEFTDAMRTTGTATWHQEDTWYDYKLDVSVFGNSFADKTSIFYNQNASSNFDNLYDCKKRKSNPGQPTLSTFGGNENLALNGLSTSNIGETVPMNLIAGANGTFTLKFEGLETFPTNTTIYVKDLVKNIVHNISEGDYTFTANQTDAVERFELIFVEAVSLDIVNIDCDGNLGHLALNNLNYCTDRQYELLLNNNLISNNVLAELNTTLSKGEYVLNVTDQYGTIQSYEFQIETTKAIEASFIVSKKNIYVGEIISISNTTNNANLISWDLGEEINAPNITNFTYSYAEAGIYQISMLASNDECSDHTTQIISVSDKTTGITNKTKDNISVYPNPTNDAINISTTDKVNIEIVNILGKIVLKTNNKTIDLKNFHSGIYFVNIYDNDNNVISINRVVKK